MIQPLGMHCLSWATHIPHHDPMPLVIGPLESDRHLSSSIQMPLLHPCRLISCESLSPLEPLFLLTHMPRRVMTEDSHLGWKKVLNKFKTALFSRLRELLLLQVA